MAFFDWNKLNKSKLAERIVQNMGLHPLVALGVICIDMMLFASDAMGPIGWGISVLVGILLMVPSILLQRFAYKDTWALSVAKGMIVGVITAIPSPLPAFLTGASGMLGTIGTIKGLLEEGGDENGEKEKAENDADVIDAEVIEVESKEL